MPEDKSFAEVEPGKLADRKASPLAHTQSVRDLKGIVRKPTESVSLTSMKPLRLSADAKIPNDRL